MTCHQWTTLHVWLQPPHPFRPIACRDESARALFHVAATFFTRESENRIKRSLQSVSPFLSEGILNVAAQSWRWLRLLISFPSTEGGSFISKNVLNETNPGGCAGRGSDVLAKESLEEFSFCFFPFFLFIFPQCKISNIYEHAISPWLA